MMTMTYTGVGLHLEYLPQIFRQPPLVYSFKLRLFIIQLVASVYNLS